MKASQASELTCAAITEGRQRALANAMSNEQLKLDLEVIYAAVDKAIGEKKFGTKVRFRAYDTKRFGDPEYKATLAHVLTEAEYLNVQTWREQVSASTNWDGYVYLAWPAPEWAVPFNQDETILTRGIK